MVDEAEMQSLRAMIDSKRAAYARWHVQVRFEQWRLIWLHAKENLAYRMIERSESMMCSGYVNYICDAII